MKPFDQLYARALDRKGEALEERMSEPKTAAELAAIPDDRYLSAMTGPIFSAGFVWRVIQNKWPGFEEAFRGFDPAALVSLSPAEIEALGQDTRIVRNGQKIDATLANAAFVMEVGEEHGSFGQYVADWESSDIIGLWADLKKRGSRLGGATGPRFLRHIGKDTFILTGDVCASLIEQGIEEKAPTSKRDLKKAQEAFNTWAEESGRPLSHISIVLACTIDSGR